MQIPSATNVRLLSVLAVRFGRQMVATCVWDSEKTLPWHFKSFEVNMTDGHPILWNNRFIYMPTLGTQFYWLHTKSQPKSSTNSFGTLLLCAFNASRFLGAITRGTCFCFSPSALFSKLSLTLQGQLCSHLAAPRLVLSSPHSPVRPTALSVILIKDWGFSCLRRALAPCPCWKRQGESGRKIHVSPGDDMGLL